MSTDWPTLRTRLPTHLNDVDLGKFRRAPGDNHLTGAWRLDGRRVEIHLECDPLAESFEPAVAQARLVRKRFAEMSDEAKAFAATELMPRKNLEWREIGDLTVPAEALTARLQPSSLWFYGDETWCIYFDDGETAQLPGLFWGLAIVVHFQGTTPTSATIEG